MPTADPELVVRLQRRNEDRVNIKSYSIQSSFLTSTDGFEFTLYDTDRSKLLELELEPVELILNGCSQLLGRIDATEIGGDGSAVRCSGRDYIADAVECNIDPTMKITEGMTLDAAIILAGAPLGIDTILSTGDILMRDVRTGVATGGGAGQKFQALTLEDLKPNPGEGVYEFCNRLVSRHGCTIQPGPSRSSLVLEEPDYKQKPLYEIRRTDDPNSAMGNNIIEATARRDYSSFPTWTTFDAKATTGGDSPKPLRQAYDILALAESIGGEMAQIIPQKCARGRRLPTESKPLKNGELYRLLYLRDEASKNIEQLKRAALRATSERLKDTLDYTVTLRGFTDATTGALWAINTMVQVNDAVLGINEPLWIESRDFSFTPQSGAVTKLTCWRPGSFQP